MHFYIDKSSWDLLFIRKWEVVNKNADNPATKMRFRCGRDLQIPIYKLQMIFVEIQRCTYPILFYHCFFYRSVNIMKIDKHGIRQNDCL